jgi:hypothetical protein
MLPVHTSRTVQPATTLPVLQAEPRKKPRKKSQRKHIFTYPRGSSVSPPINTTELAVYQAMVTNHANSNSCMWQSGSSGPVPKARLTHIEVPSLSIAAQAFLFSAALTSPNPLGKLALAKRCIPLIAASGLAVSTIIILVRHRQTEVFESAQIGVFERDVLQIGQEWETLGTRWRERRNVYDASVGVFSCVEGLGAIRTWLWSMVGMALLAIVLLILLICEYAESD